MMNAQILTKTLVPSGQNAQSLQGPQPGSNPARTQDTRQATSDPVATTSSTQDGKTEASDTPNDFKHALTEKMAEPEQEQGQESKESSAESPDPTAVTLQATVAQGQASALGVTQPAAPLDQTLPNVPVTPMPNMPDPGQAKHPGDQMQLPDGGVNEPSGQRAGIEVSPDLSSATQKGASGTQAPVAQAAPLPEPSSTQGTEILQSPASSVTQTVTQTVTTPVRQAATRPQGLSSEQGSAPQPAPVDLPKSTTTDAVAPQPSAPKPAQSEAVPAAPETKQAPTFEIQSIPEAAPRDIKGKTEPLHTPSIKQGLQTDTPAPLQVTAPAPQANTAMFESSQAQPANMPGNPAPVEIDPSNMPTLTAPDTQTTPEAAEVTLPRSLDPTSNPLPRQIQDTIALAVQQNSRQLVIRLDPPELGRVAIRFQEDSQGITGVLEVQRSQTRHDIQQALPEIIQQLQDSGVPVKRIEVLLSADADAETFEDQAFAQARDQDLEHQQGSEQNKARRNPAYGWPSSNEEEVHRRAQDQYASDQGINLLI
jgi:flagellar hook-length control protein FliK